MLPADRAKVDQWNRRFLKLAKTFAEWSVDPSTRVGCVIVGPANEIRSYGYNGLPRNIEDSGDRFDRPGKYVWVEHAERNAIYAAALNGVSTLDCRIYLTWFPCADCARAIIQSGIRELIAIEPDWASERWGDQFQLAREMLLEGGVRITFVSAETESEAIEDLAAAIEVNR